MWTLAYGDHEDRRLTHGYEGLGFRGFSRPTVFSAFGQVLIIGSDIEHLLFGDRIGHALRHCARFLRTVAPVLWII
jgi:hypothetical protein